MGSSTDSKAPNFELIDFEMLNSEMIGFGLRLNFETINFGNLDFVLLNFEELSFAVLNFAFAGLLVDCLEAVALVTVFEVLVEVSRELDGINFEVVVGFDCWYFGHHFVDFHFVDFLHWVD